MFVTLANYIITLVCWRDSSQEQDEKTCHNKQRHDFSSLNILNSFINYEASQACFQETYQLNIGQLNRIEIHFFYKK